MTDSRVVLIFVDGFGLGSKQDNPIVSSMPFLNELTGGFHGNRPLPLVDKSLVFTGIDATLGVSGIPQSATGQTALLTGLNAAEMLGRHVHAYPGRELKHMLCKHSVFLQLKRAGLSSAFANAFRPDSILALEQRRYKMTATTAAVLTAGIELSMFSDVRSGRAVPHDITSWSLQREGYQIDSLTPEQSADNCLQLSSEHNCTLFEYFMTDIAGHRGSKQERSYVLSVLDQFCNRLISRCSDNTHVIITSDHGNIEDDGCQTHTTNPVPLLVWGRDSHRAVGCSSILDVTPLIFDLLGAG